MVNRAFSPSRKRSAAAGLILQVNIMINRAREDAFPRRLGQSPVIADKKILIQAVLRSLAGRTR